MSNKRLKKQQHRRKRQQVKRAKQFAQKPAATSPAPQPSVSESKWPEVVGAVGVAGVILGAAWVLFDKYADKIMVGM